MNNRNLLPFDKTAPGRFFACLALGLFITLPAAARDARSLTLAQSMDMSVQNNLTLKLAKAQTEAARARATQAAAGLLPHLMATLGETKTYRENLDALGFAGYGFIGPFDTFDARISLVQEIFNWTTYERLHSQKQKEQSALLRQDLASEQVCAAAALSYIEVLRADSALEAARADERLAQELLTLAQERHSAGTATGLDVAREKTRVAQEHSRVLYAQVACDDAGLRLRHVVGLQLDEELKLADSLAVSATTFPEINNTISSALADRMELAIGRAELQSADYAISAAQGGHLPSIVVTGDIAISGIEPNDKAGSVGDLGIQLRLPLFEGGAVSASVREAQAAKIEVSAKLDDMTVQVQEDVRLALKRLAAAVEQADTAEQAVALADSELSMAQGRFSAGVGDTVELVNAQTSLSEARSTRVAALAQYNNSKINLALAQGHMRTFSIR